MSQRRGQKNRGQRNRGHKYRSRLDRGPKNTASRRWSLLAATAVTALAGLSLTACSSHASAAGSSSSGNTGTSSAASANGYAKKLSVLYVSGSTPGDVFWASAQKGAEQAATDENASFEWLAPSSASGADVQEAKLLQAAITKHPDAIVVANGYPSSLDPLIKQATSQGITVVVSNSGQDTWRSDGAIAYVGQSDFQAGVEAGAEMAKAGIKVAICENVPGFQVSMQRCGGFAKGFAAGGGTSIDVDLVLAQVTDPTYVERALEAILNTHKNAQAVMATGVIGWTPAVAAIKQLGETSTIKLASFDLSTGDLQATASGANLFLVDQQPYLEGYDAVQAALQYIRYGLLPADGTIATGPDIITQPTAANVLKYNSLGVRGAS